MEKHKSGAQKRKDRREAERKKSAKKCRPITGFTIPMPQPQVSPQKHVITMTDTGTDEEPTASASNFTQLYINTNVQNESHNTGTATLPTCTRETKTVTTGEPRSDQEIPVTASALNKDEDQQLHPTIRENNLFQYPSRTDLKSFFKEHPIQPHTHDLPFDAKVYYRKIMCESVLRQWLTFNKMNRRLYCSFCLAFESPTSSNPSAFVRGFNDYRRISQLLSEHESTTMHSKHAQEYITVVNDGGLDRFLAASLQKRKDEVLKQRNIVARVIDIIKMLGKQGLPFRGHRNESAYSLLDETENHGIFLATVQLMAKYDPIMASHVSTVQEKSQQRRERLEKQGKAQSKGRGGLNTYLSKTTISSLSQIMTNMIQKKIAEEVSEAKYYSIQVDSTQDISSIDEFSIVIRYVLNGTINERLLAIVPSNDGTGQELFNLLNETLQRLEIDPKKCLSDSTDGAASYHGQYNGLQRKIADVADQHVHIWCYAHVLNLVVTETTKCCVPAISFFNLLQNLAKFVKVSYKRMAIWIEVVGDNLGNQKMKRLKLIGETRWSGKSNTATTIFGNYNEICVSTFVDLLTCLSIIQGSNKFDAKTKQEVKVLLSNLLEFETILTAFTYLYIFQVTSPLSSYLQTDGLDMFTAWNMVEKAISDLNKKSREFDKVHSQASKFVEKTNEYIAQINDDENYQAVEVDSVKTELPVKRKRETKRMAGEQAVDERDTSDSLSDYRVHVFNLIMDRVIQSMESRFTDHRQLYKDMSCLDPSNFDSIIENSLENEALDSILKLAPEINENEVKFELHSFASNFKILKLLLNNSNTKSSSGMDSSCKYCGMCLSCVLNILASNRLNDKAYDNLYQLYKVICTLSVTQVECERAFSKLKIIKTRLRNSLSEDNLEAYMLLSVEKRCLDEIDIESIIDRFAYSSTELKRLLIL